jgi:hypothetical protein
MSEMTELTYSNDISKAFADLKVSLGNLQGRAGNSTSFQRTYLTQVRSEIKMLESLFGLTSNQSSNSITNEQPVSISKKDSARFLGWVLAETARICNFRGNGNNLSLPRGLVTLVRKRAGQLAKSGDVKRDVLLKYIRDENTFRIFVETLGGRLPNPEREENKSNNRSRERSNNSSSKPMNSEANSGRNLQTENSKGPSLSLMGDYDNQVSDSIAFFTERNYLRSFEMLVVQADKSDKLKKTHGLAFKFLAESADLYKFYLSYQTIENFSFSSMKGLIVETRSFKGYTKRMRTKLKDLNDTLCIFSDFPGKPSFGNQSMDRYKIGELTLSHWLTVSIKVADFAWRLFEAPRYRACNYHFVDYDLSDFPFVTPPIFCKVWVDFGFDFRAQEGSNIGLSFPTMSKDDVVMGDHIVGQFQPADQGFTPEMITKAENFIPIFQNQMVLLNPNVSWLQGE